MSVPLLGDLGITERTGETLVVLATDGRPPDPATAANATEFVECLNRLRAWAGQPSLRTLRRLAGTTWTPGGERVDALPETTMSSVLRGKRLPRLPRMTFVESFVAACMVACGRSPENGEREIDRWRRAWRILAQPAAEAGPQERPNACCHLSAAPANSRIAHATVPMELPSDIGTFTGRRREMETLERLSAGSAATERTATAAASTTSTTATTAITAATVVVIDGMAGVGKSALAVHWAHRVADRFPDGLLYVDLRGHSAAGQPVTAASALTRLLRAVEPGAQLTPAATEDELVARYRSAMAGRRVLVLLDDARSAEQVRPLLPNRPGSLAVVTGRHRLSGLAAVDDARLFTLGPLSRGEAVGLLKRILATDPGGCDDPSEPHSPSAPRAKPARDLPPAPADPVDARTVAAGELASRCGYLPLALRIAAARVDAFREGVDEVTARMKAGGRIEALRIPDDPRATLRTAFDLSYRDLDAAERRLFTRLAGLAGDFDACTAASANDAEVPHTRRLLDRLAAAHLVERCAHGRFRLHDLLREYAAERAAAERARPPFRARAHGSANGTGSAGSGNASSTGSGSASSGSASSAGGGSASSAGGGSASSAGGGSASSAGSGNVTGSANGSGSAGTRR
jgi:hypothetical protein